MRCCSFKLHNCDVKGWRVNKIYIAPFCKVMVSNLCSRSSLGLEEQQMEGFHYGGENFLNNVSLCPN